ncbi:MAG: YraN family protein [Hyphomicrobiales bacterium]|nr:YraN family protein [Hyphomicrobiales bacterium]MCP5370388.1 YraN family protein [Hyphomicrobiales bacterium]
MAKGRARGRARGRESRRRAWRYGRWAETLCVLRLRLAGYAIVARRFRRPVGEIDIAARRGRVLAVVEVKARQDPQAAAESLGPRQRRRIRRAALALVAARPALAGLDLRFDVMVVAAGPLGLALWPRHIRDAWREDF